ncbi:MAG: site-specific integrase [Candidatus Aminicenantales bacterium]|jgi:integrase
MKRIHSRDKRNLFFRDGWWWIDIQVKGQRYREKAGPTETKARDYRDKLRAWGRDSAQGLPAKRPEGEVVRFSAFADDYLRLYACHKRSYDWDERSVGQLKKFFSTSALKDISAEGVDRYRASRVGLSTATINREVACLRAILYLAVRYGKLAAYPLPMKGLLKREPEFKPRILELEEARRLVEVADPGYLRDAIVIYLGTGMRRRELLDLPRRDVDFRRGELTITADRAKNGKARTIPLDAQVLEVLRFRPGKEYFFENPRTGEPISSLDIAWVTAKARAGIKGRLRIHDLRDTYATWQLRAGIDIRTVSELIGDTPTVALNRYCRSDAKTKRAAVENLPDLLGSRLKLHAEAIEEPATLPESIN